MIPGLGSLRGRIIALSVVVILGVCTTALVLTGKAEDLFEHSRQTTSRLDEIIHSLELIKRALYNAEGELYRSAVLMNSGQRPHVQAVHVQALEEIERLQALATRWGDAELNHQTELLRSHVISLGESIQRQFELPGTAALANMQITHSDSAGAVPEETGHESKESPFFQERLKTVFADIWNVVMALDLRLNALVGTAMEESMTFNRTVIWGVWFITALTAMFILLANVFYEFLIRRPMAQLTHALRALEQGASYSPLMRASSREMDAMLAAFRDMQRQVYAREMRLAAILDNAGEGIITINQEGRIETFNNAAEQLFQFHAEEVLGRNVSILMPQPTCDEHDQYLKRYLASGEGRVLGNEMNVTAKRKDGTLFPMSIKITETMLEGRHYFTAIVSDISEHKAMLDHLRQMAEHDSLTGLYNRQYFLDELERVVERAQRSAGLDCALLYIDLEISNT